MNKREISELFGKFGAELEQDDVWQVQSATVIKHKALERLAAKAGVEWDKPVVLRAERDEAVIMVSGKIGDRLEWSIGEALVVPMSDTGRKNNYGKPIYEAHASAMGNYQITPKQAAYPFAMAEKRGKDRVIIKLCGLHGLYSEDEADEFKEQPSAPPARKPGGDTSSPSASPPAHHPAPEPRAITSAQLAYVEAFSLALGQCETAHEVYSLKDAQKEQRAAIGITARSEAAQRIKTLMENRLEALGATMEAA